MGDLITSLESKRLEKLKPRELASCLMSFPPRQRMELILSREDAAAVVAAMPEQDFYITIKEVGPNDALALLRLAQIDQLNHLFDIEWWKKDQLIPAKALRWLELLAQASEHKFTQWIYQVDFELLVSLFKKWIRVEVLPDDAELMEVRDKLPPLTIDDQYFWECRYPQYEDFIRSVLCFLFETHQGFYRELMNHVIYALDAEFEEIAYQFHKGRLEDRAIPDFYDALEIYRSIRPEEIPYGKMFFSSEKSPPLKPPFFPMTLVSEGDIFVQALSAIDDQRILDSLQLELAAVSNKVVVADQLSPDDPEALREAARKAAAMINLGLDILSRGEQSLASVIIQRTHLEYLFRFGNTRIARLRDTANRLVKQGWLSRWPFGINFLEFEWQERLELLMQKTPKIKRDGQEDFLRNRFDIHQARQFLSVLNALQPVFDELAKCRGFSNLIGVRLWKEAQINRPEDITLGVVMFTVLANFLWRGEWVVEPLPIDLWFEIFPVLNPEKVKQAMHRWLTRGTKDYPGIDAVKPYIHFLIKWYKEEMEAFSPENIPESKLVPFFLFSDK